MAYINIIANRVTMVTVRISNETMVGSDIPQRSSAFAYSFPKTRISV
jgi:hypothetical protein